MHGVGKWGKTFKQCGKSQANGSFFFFFFSPEKNLFLQWPSCHVFKISHRYLCKFWFNTTPSITCKYSVFKSVKTGPDCHEFKKNTNTLKSTAWLRHCCVRPMWANVGFGARHDEVTNKVGIKKMCHWVSSFKTWGKCTYVAPAFLSHKKTKRRRSWRKKKTHKSYWGNALRWKNLETL